MKKKNVVYVAQCILIFLSVLDTRYSFAQDDPKFSIAPSIVTVLPGQKETFKITRQATMLGPATAAGKVSWSVNDVKGGNSELGTIDAAGNYTAPAKVPSPHEIHIVGQVEGQNQKLFATVKMDENKLFYKSIYQYSEDRATSKHFGNPHGVALDKDGNLIIVDADTHYVMRFSPDGKFLGYISKGGQEDGQFHSPRVVLLDKKDGDLYISDQKEFGNRLQIFSNDGKLKKAFGPRGNGTGQLLRAHGMNFDSKGNLVVVDVDNSRVTRFSPEGEYINSWGEDGPYNHQFNAPHGLVVDPNDEVFVAGYYGNIQKYDANGNFLFSFAEGNPPGGSVYIHAISGDKWGNVYSMVRGMRGFGGLMEISKDKIYSIEKFNNNGDFVCGITLSLKSHSENWVFVGDNGYLYALYRGEKTVGFEILAPQ